MRLRVADHPAAESKPRLTNARLHRADMTDADVSGWKFDKCRFDGADVTGLEANGAIFVNCSLRSVKGDRASFDRSHIENSDMSGSTVGFLSFRNARLHNVIMSNVDVRRLHADGVQVHGIVGSLRVRDSGAMRNATIQGVDFNLDAKNLDMSSAHVTESPRFTTRLSGGTIEGGRFIGVGMEHSEWSGVSAPGLRIEASNLQSVRLEDNDLSFATIDVSLLDRAILKKNSLRGATMRQSSGESTTLEGNNLFGANLAGLSGRLAGCRENATSTTTRLSPSMERFDRTARAAKRLFKGRTPDIAAQAGLAAEVSNARPHQPQARRGEDR